MQCNQIKTVDVYFFAFVPFRRGFDGSVNVKFTVSEKLFGDEAKVLTAACFQSPKGNKRWIGALDSLVLPIKFRANLYKILEG